MKILASGCSFTAGGPGAGENWVSYIAHKNYVRNVAMSGAGNNYILNSTMTELLERPKFYDMVLVMWSGLQRLDYMISKETYQALEYSRVETTGIHWALGGDIVSHASNNMLLRPIGKQYFSLSDEETLGCKSLLHMISLQNFLKANNVPYRFMSYVNYWNDNDNITNLNFGLYKYESCRKLLNHIDFDQFIFYNNQQDGLYEFAQEKNLMSEDGFHPSQEGYRSWASLVKENI